MAEGVDYSWARPGAAALKAAGKTFVVRYLYRDGQGGKGLDASELADLQAHGLDVAVVYEGGNSRVLSGRAAGVTDAQAAQAQLTALGLPALPVYFAVDFNATAAQQGPIDDYLRGVASVLGLARVGVYGGLGPVQRCQANGTAAWFWQTYGWSGGAVASGIHLYQYRNGQTINGGLVDFCRSMQAEFGQHASTTASLNATPLIIQEDDMPRYIRNSDTGTIAIGALGVFWVELPEPAYVTLLDGWKLWDRTQDLNLPDNIYQFVKSFSQRQNAGSIVTKIVQALTVKGNTVDTASVAQAVDAALADDFAAIPHAVLTAAATQLAK